MEKQDLGYTLWLNMETMCVHTVHWKTGIWNIMFWERDLFLCRCVGERVSAIEGYSIMGVCMSKGKGGGWILYWCTPCVCALCYLLRPFRLWIHWIIADWTWKLAVFISVRLIPVYFISVYPLALSIPILIHLHLVTSLSRHIRTCRKYKIKLFKLFDK